MYVYMLYVLDVAALVLSSYDFIFSLHFPTSEFLWLSSVIIAMFVQ